MKNICVLTGTRAEYGLLKNLINKIHMSEQYNLLLFVTGSHLEKNGGFTFKNIEEDGFNITEKIYMNLNNDSANGILQSMSIELSKLSLCFDKYDIDLVILFGDRTEMLIAAQVALIYNINRWHLCGGDISEGSYDNYIRNAITKLSNKHFVSCQDSFNNIVNMGEKKEDIFLVGNPGLNDIINFKSIEKTIFYDKFKLDLHKKFILVIYHSETLESKNTNIENTNILFDSLLEILNTNIIIINSNLDNYNNIINKKILYISNKYEHIFNYTSLDRIDYLNMINYCELYIGNSSSGIYEVPLFNKYTLNIGDRQKNRLSCNSIINLNYNKQDIINNINNILNNVISIDNIDYPYILLNSSEEIYKIIVEYI
jgi:GDP/UDP-N,N'-diacetylbacillosamine 2-epimerase (hydrolysing)